MYIFILCVFVCARALPGGGSTAGPTCALLLLALNCYDVFIHTHTYTHAHTVCLIRCELSNLISCKT